MPDSLSAATMSRHRGASRRSSTGIEARWIGLDLPGILASVDVSDRIFNGNFQIARRNAEETLGVRCVENTWLPVEIGHLHDLAHDLVLAREVVELRIRERLQLGYCDVSILNEF